MTVSPFHVEPMLAYNDTHTYIHTYIHVHAHTCVHVFLVAFKFLLMPAKITKPEPKIYHIAPQSTAFADYFNGVQTQLETLASMDDLLSG